MTAPLVDRQAHRHAVIVRNLRIIQKIRLIVDPKFLFQALAGLILLLRVQFAPVWVLTRLKRRGKVDEGCLGGWNVPSCIILQDIAE
jgi:hypothetical protein